MDFLDTLKADHRRLLTQVEELERILTGLADSLSSTARNELRDRLQQLIELLSSHDELERRELFPALRDYLPESDHWQVEMIDVEDEMILTEARHLFDLASGAASSAPVERLKEGGARLLRWVRVHVRVEEEHLFPRLQDLP